MRRTAVILFMVLVGIASVAFAQNYTVTDLGVLSGDSAVRAWRLIIPG